MQSVQRQFGRMLHKSPGDNAKVAVLLSDVSYNPPLNSTGATYVLCFECGLCIKTVILVYVSKARF